MHLIRNSRIVAFLLFIIINSCAFAQEQHFDQLLDLDWDEVFFDKGDGNWQENWFLDGKKATIKNEELGMVFSAGPVERENESHAVLWTKKSLKAILKLNTFIPELIVKSQM